MVGSKDEQRQLANEYRILSRLSHPNVVQVFDFVRQDEDVAYMTMEYIQGQEIHELVRTDGNEPRLLTSLLLQVCNAFDYIHSHGIAHGDVSCRNLLVTKTITVPGAAPSYLLKLIDFGMAEMFRGRGQRVGSPRTQGTAPFMAPEIVSNQPPDVRSDIYSLGVVLFELITGSNPFRRTALAETFQAILNLQIDVRRELQGRTSPRLERLVERMMAREPGLRPRNALEVARRALTPSKARKYLENKIELRSGEFVGRKDAMDQLAQLHARCQPDHPQSALIMGPLGIGKSRLLTEFQREAQLAGARVIRTSWPTDQANSLLGLQELLTHALDVAGGEREAILERYRAALRTVLPSEYMPAAGESARPRDEEQIDQNVFFQCAVATLQDSIAAAAAESSAPVLLLLEDLPATGFVIRLLNRLAQQEGDYPAEQSGKRGYALLIVASTECQQISAAPLPSGSLAAVPFGARIELAPLTRDATAALVKSMLGARDLNVAISDRIYAASGGLPMHVGEVLRTLAETRQLVRRKGVWEERRVGKLAIPDSIQDLVRLRTQGLRLAEQTTLRYAALLNQAFTAEDLAQAMRVSANDVAGWLAVLINRGLMTMRTSQGLVFYDYAVPAARAVIIEAMTADERFRCHKRLARVLEARVKSGKRSWEGAAAHQFIQSGNRIKGLEYAKAAARAAANAFSYTEAIDYYQQALDCLGSAGPLKERFDILVEMAAIKRLSEPDTARHLYQQALAIVSEHRFPAERTASALLGLASLETARGDISGARKLLEDAQASIPSWSTSLMGLKIAMELAYLDYREENYDRVIEMCDRVLPKARELRNDELVAQIYRTKGTALAAKQQYDAAIEMLQIALSMMEQANNVLRSALLLLDISRIRFIQGKFTEAASITNRAIAILERAGDLRRLAYAYHTAGATQSRMGNPDAAVDMLTRALDTAARIQDAELQCEVLNQLGAQFLEMSDLDLSRTYLERGIKLATERNLRHVLSRLQFTNSRWLVIAGKGDEAVKAVEKSLQARGGSDVQGLASAQEMLAYTFKDRGDADKAEKLFRDAIQGFTQVRNTLRLSSSHRGLSEALLLKSDFDGAIAAINLADDYATAAKDELESGKVAHVRGQILAARGNFSGARHALEHARDIFVNSGRIYYLSRVLRSLGRLFGDNGDSDKALALLRAARDNFRRSRMRKDEEECEREIQRASLAAKPQSSGTHVFATISTFAAIAKLLNSIDDPEDLLEKILEQAIEFIGGERGIIFLINPETQELEPAVYRNVDGETISDAKDVSSNILRLVLSGEPVLSANAQQDPHLQNYQSIRALSILSVLCTPLRVRGEKIGSLYLDSRSRFAEFTERDRDSAFAFADFAAVAIDRAQYIKQRFEENLSLKQALDEHRKFQNLMIGSSKEMRELFSQLERFAAIDATVLIEGENGTGKELAARAIHLNSNRGQRAFLPINIAAIPENLLESELFGFVRGAFTSADARHLGAFMAADGGTILLDEIGELRLDLQPKLLRVIEYKEIRPLGYDGILTPNVRIIASTNKDLLAEVRKGRFREDLYFRLSRLTVRVPPLRERREDVPALAMHFLKRFADQYKREYRGFTQDTLDCFKRYSWPGNVRQLSGAVEHSVVMGSPPYVRAKHLPEEIRRATASYLVEPAPAENLLTLEQLEEQHIRKVLQAVSGKKIEAAKILGVSRPTLDRKIQRYNLRSRRRR